MGEVRLNIMMPSYSAYYYSISHNKYRTVSRPSYPYCGVPHTWKDHFNIETGPCFVIDTSLSRHNIETFWDILLQWPVCSPRNRPGTRKMFQFDYVSMSKCQSNRERGGGICKIYIIRLYTVDMLFISYVKYSPVLCVWTSLSFNSTVQFQLLYSTLVI